jgi:predicted polyphosphate/ATP-dependent NAD kinase
MSKTYSFPNENMGIALLSARAPNARIPPPKHYKIGLIINPIAGMGGRVGLKGTDGLAVLAEARRRGAQPVSATRAFKALERLAVSSDSITLLTGAGELGEDAAKAAGFTPVVIYRPQSETSKPADTQAVALEMVRESVDLVLFAGGDGTARDVLRIVGDRIPILGIPTGVKMYSAVFGTTPGNAGALAERFIAGDSNIRVRDAEVMDIDEDAIRNDRVSTQLYGYARSPHLRKLVQNAKAGSMPSEDVALEAICRQIAREMRSGCLYIVGPGTTTRRVMSALSLPSTLLGVDVVLDGKLIGSDLNETELLQLMDGRESYLVVGVLGGHGSLFGRGNQQISAEVIRKVGRANIIVVASLEKLIGLATRCLHVDTGDDDINQMLSGYLPVRTAPDRTIYFKVQA